MLGVLQAVSVIRQSEGVASKFRTLEFTTRVSQSKPLHSIWELRLTRQSLGNFFIHNDKDLNAALSCGLEHVVQTIALIAGGRTTQVQLWAARMIGPVSHIFSSIALKANTITSATNRGYRCTPAPLM